LLSRLQLLLYKRGPFLLKQLEAGPSACKLHQQLNQWPTIVGGVLSVCLDSFADDRLDDFLINLHEFGVVLGADVLNVYRGQLNCVQEQVEPHLFQLSDLGDVFTLVNQYEFVFERFLLAGFRFVVVLLGIIFTSLRV
jgi:hypothetical protein